MFLKELSIVLLGNIKMFFVRIINVNRIRYNIKSKINLSSEIITYKKSYISIGKRVRIGKRTKIVAINGGKIHIGDNTGINSDCKIVSHQSIKLEDNVQIGPNVMIYDHDHDYKNLNRLKNLEYVTSPITIGENTWIGANVIILRGTNIGKNCVIGAGAIVKGNYPDNSLIVQKRQETIRKIIRNE